MYIYEDYTTTVYMEPFHGEQQFRDTVVRNIFDSNSSISTLNISRGDDAYIGLNTNYRGSVTLNNCGQSQMAFKKMKYFGHNHGHWLIESNGKNGLHDAEIYASADDSLNPYGGVSGYNISVIATGF